MDNSDYSVWVSGEVLIDLMPGLKGRVPTVGGGPANTAKALSNLGIKTSFVGGISRDAYGKLIRNELLDYGVDISLSRDSNLPTATASIQFNEEGGAIYNFKFENTATFDFGDWLPKSNPNILYTGSLAALIEPGAGALFTWAKSMKTAIFYDPNVRPSVVKEKSRYLESFYKWAEISRVIKLSLEDLTWLGLSTSRILELGPKLVILTKGSDGISAFTHQETRHQKSEKIEIVDTVGAGDTVGAVIVEEFLKDPALSGDTLENLLKRAVRAAAITCTRAGAKPPTLEELNG